MVAKIRFNEKGFIPIAPNGAKTWDERDEMFERDGRSDADG